MKAFACSWLLRCVLYRVFAIVIKSNDVSKNIIFKSILNQYDRYYFMMGALSKIVYILLNCVECYKHNQLHDFSY